MPPIPLLVVWGLFAVVTIVLRASLLQNDRYRQRLLQLNMNSYRKSQYLAKLPAWYYHGSAVLRVLIGVWAVSVVVWLLVAHSAWTLLLLYVVVGAGLFYGNSRLGLQAVPSRATNPPASFLTYLSLLLFWPPQLLYVPHAAQVARDHRRTFLNSFGPRNFQRLSPTDRTATLYSRAELNRLFAQLAAHLNARPIAVYQPLMLLAASCLLWAITNLREVTGTDGMPPTLRVWVYLLLVAHLLYLAAVIVSPLGTNPVIALLRRTPRRVSLYQFNSLAALVLSYLLLLTVFYVWQAGAGVVNTFTVNRVVTIGFPADGRFFEIEIAVWGSAFVLLFLLALVHVLLDMLRFRRTDADLRHAANAHLLRRHYQQAAAWADRVRGDGDDPARLRQTALGAALGVNDWERAYALLAHEDSAFAEALLLANSIAHTPLAANVRNAWLREMLLRATTDEMRLTITTVFLQSGAVAPRSLLVQLRSHEVHAPITMAVLNYTAGEIQASIKHLQSYTLSESEETTLDLVARLVDVWLSLETSETNGVAMVGVLKSTCDALDRTITRLDRSDILTLQILRYYLDRTSSLFVAQLGVEAYHEKMAWLDVFVLQFDRKTDRILRDRPFTPFDDPYAVREHGANPG